MSASIIGQTTIPLLIVPPLSEWRLPKKILLVVNHLKAEEENTTAVFQLAQLFNASVYIGFFTEDYSDESELTPDQKQTILNYRQNLEAKYPRTSIRVFHIGGHLFKETIEDYIQQHNFDLVAMVTYKRTFLQSLFHPSMTKKMSYTSHIPLLAIPAQSNLVPKTK
ncbi:MAG: universal stress protein [Chitinophagaceae bacterium]